MNVLHNKRHPGFWINASWLSDVIDPDACPECFRSEVVLPKPCQSAILRITACDCYLLKINGRVAARGPARSLERRKCYDEVDISRFLQRGQNALAVIVTAPTPTSIRAGRRGLWCSFEIMLTDGQTISCVTDEQWRACRMPGHVAAHLPLSTSLPWQEHSDLRRMPSSWDSCPISELPAYWRSAWVVGPADWTPPWRHLVPRSTRMLTCLKAAVRLVWKGLGPAQMSAAGKNLACQFNRLQLQGRRLNQPPPDEISLQAGEIITFDFGSVRLLVPEIKAHASGTGIRLEAYWDIRLGERPTATDSNETAVGGLADSWRLRQGDNVVTVITPRGARYWTLRVTGQGAVKIFLGFYVLEYPYDDDSAVLQIQPNLLVIWDTARRTIRAATMDAIVDTIWREQAVWTQDVAVTGPAIFFCYGETSIWRRSLELIAESIDADGIPRAVALQGPTHAVIFDQTMTWCRSVLEYALYSGDLESPRKWFTAIERFLNYCHRHLTPDNLFVAPEFSWTFIDWGTVNRKPYSLALNALLYSAALTIASLAQLLGKSSCASRLATHLAQGLKGFPRLSSGFLADRFPCQRHWRLLSHNLPDDSDTDYPLHGNSVLLDTGFFGEDSPHIAARLASVLPQTSDRQYSPAWSEQILGALMRHGQPEAALRELRRRTTPLLNEDVPTFGESFPFTKENSAHGWGSQLALLITRDLWGLRFLAPGGSRIAVKPPITPPDGHYSLRTPAGWLRLFSEHGHIRSHSDMDVFFPE